MRRCWCGLPDRSDLDGPHELPALLVSVRGADVVRCRRIAVVVEAGSAAERWRMKLWWLRVPVVAWFVTGLILTDTVSTSRSTEAATAPCASA